MGYKITFDLDGVFVDIWTPIEARIRASTLSDLTVRANTMAEYQELVDLVDHFSWSKITNCDYSDLTEVQRKFIFSLFDRKTYTSPLAMFSGEYTQPTSNWLDACLTGNISDKRVFFKDYAYWLGTLTQMPTVDEVTICARSTPQLMGVRRDWVNTNLRSYAPRLNFEPLDWDSTHAPDCDLFITGDLRRVAYSPARVKILYSNFANMAVSMLNQKVVGSQVATFLCVADAMSFKKAVETALQTECDFKALKAYGEKGFN